MQTFRRVAWAFTKRTLTWIDTRFGVAEYQGIKRSVSWPKLVVDFDPDLPKTCAQRCA